MGHEAAARSREAALLALAALSFNHEPTRSHIADAAPPVLPLVCAALSHPSYGVRAAACQLARALSRTVSIVRTSLVDSGVAEEVIETLKREIERRQVGGQDGPLDARDWDVTAEEELGNRMWTVEEAATATICNLVTDFAPVRNVSCRHGQLGLLTDNFQKFLSAGGIELFVGLTSSTHEPLVENALWTLKNLLYHAPESLKSDVMAALGWPTLREMVSPGVPPLLRRQALELLQNIVDNQLAADLALTLDGLGADWLVDTLTAMVASAVGTAGGRAPSASEEALAVPSLYVLSQLALGSERQRAGLTARVELLDALSQALNSRNDSIRYPALRTLTNLVKSNARGQRPRQAVVDLLQPYQLRMRLRDIAERAGAQRESVTAGDLAVDLLNLLERAR